MRWLCTLMSIVSVTVALFPLQAQSASSNPATRMRPPQAAPAAQSLRSRVARLAPTLRSPMVALSPELLQVVAARAISVPFGFETPLILRDAGQTILVNGHGGCEAGQTVAIQVDITQSTTGAHATGETQTICTGDLQFWNTTAMAVDPVRFVPGPANACGVATTSSDGVMTDTSEWCRDVTLVMDVYLPLMVGS